VIGSNRPQRICPEIAGWVQRALRATNLWDAELTDLQDLDLPFLDEPLMPARGHYQHEHTVRWSELVQSYNGFGSSSRSATGATQRFSRTPWISSTTSGPTSRRAW
jgi:NAD(P)H-dependent FMN reductase